MIDICQSCTQVKNHTFDTSSYFSSNSNTIDMANCVSPEMGRSVLSGKRLFVVLATLCKTSTALTCWMKLSSMAWPQPRR